MRVIFSGGGTGGHIYPALAIREKLLQEFGNELETAYVGLDSGMEAKIVGRVEGLPFLSVRAQGMPRGVSFKWFSFPFANFLGIIDAVCHLRKFKPDFVVTTGGYVAFPVLMAARLLGIPAVIHEQNAAMGVTNRLFAKSAKAVFLTYESAYQVDNKRVFATGNPVRSFFLSLETDKNRFDKKDGEFWVLFVGGSRGALSINRACIELTKTWLKKNPDVKILHICGERDFEMVKTETEAVGDQYILLPYLHEMKEAFSVADVLVSRAGATILAEIAVCAKPAILVPFPFATDNHQEKNARVLEKSGAANVILDRNLNGESLGDALTKLKDGGQLVQMAENMKKTRPADVEGRIVGLIKDFFINKN